MGGLDHGPSGPMEQESAATISRNSRYGLRLFAVYFVVYAVFVWMNAFRPSWMGETVKGLNLAVSYGFGLILLALLLALVYGWLCRHDAPSSEPRTDSREEST